MRKNSKTKSQRVNEGIKNAKNNKKAKKRAKENFIKNKHRNLMIKHELKRRIKFLEALAQKAKEEQDKKTENQTEVPVSINTEQK